MSPKYLTVVNVDQYLGGQNQYFFQIVLKGYKNIRNIENPLKSTKLSFSTAIESKSLNVLNHIHKIFNDIS